MHLLFSFELLLLQQFNEIVDRKIGVVIGNADAGVENCFEIRHNKIRIKRLNISKRDMFRHMNNSQTIFVVATKTFGGINKIYALIVFDSRGVGETIISCFQDIKSLLFNSLFQFFDNFVHV